MDIRFKPTADVLAQWRKEGVQKWEENQKTNPTPINPHAYVDGYIAAREVAHEEIIRLKDRIHELHKSMSRI